MSVRAIGYFFKRYTRALGTGKHFIFTPTEQLGKGTEDLQNSRKLSSLVVVMNCTTTVPV